MNNFQSECVEAIQKVLREKGLGVCRFKEVAGKTQQYLLADVVAGGIHYEIYVYEDEAGLSVGKEWFICEKPDYRSPQELIQAISRMLLEKLPSVSTK